MSGQQSTPTAWGGKQFARVPLALIRSKAFRQLSGAEQHVLLEIIGCASRDGYAYPGILYLAQHTGRHQRTVERAVDKLEEMGILKLGKAGGGKGRPNEYQLQVPDSDETDDNINPGHLAGVSEGDKPRSSRPQTPVISPSKPRSSRRSHPYRNEQLAEQTAAEADSAAADDKSLPREEQRSALEDTGLAGCEYLLAEQPEATPEDIQAAMRGASPSAGTGARVKHFRQNVQAAIADRREQERHEQAAAERWEAEVKAAGERLDAIIAELEAQHDDEIEARLNVCTTEQVKNGLRRATRMLTAECSKSGTISVEAAKAAICRWARGVDALNHKAIRTAIAYELYADEKRKAERASA